MELLILIVGCFVLAGVLFAVSSYIQNPRTPFVDRDLDGEPDEPNGPAKDL